MIQSMTGFGKSSLQLPTKKISVEIKSLNSKGLDLNLRIPSHYREMELVFRNQIGTQLERGKIDFSILIESIVEQSSNRINLPIINLYINQLKEICPEASETELLKIAIRMPDVLKLNKDEIDEQEWAAIQKSTQEAVENLINFRINEGLSLKKELELRIASIQNYMHSAVALDKERIQTVKDRLQTAIEELKPKYDENRFEQELIYYLEKFDITEEKVRLSTHLDYFIETMDQSESNGKKLGFIAQEMGREINTMGAKANHSSMQKFVVMMKDELEKIKEQLLNVL